MAAGSKASLGSVRAETPGCCGQEARALKLGVDAVDVV
jgi:hypothetical protein